MATPTNPRRVVLHFDLNRTVLMSDAAGGRSMENTVNYLLSECAWGRVDAATNKWHCVSREASVTPPTSSDALCTYKQFVDDQLPYQSLADHAPDQVDAVKAFNKTAKKQRTALQSAFTSHGSPGHMLLKSFELVMDKLHFPEGDARATAKRVAATMPPSRLQEAFLEGRYYLLPSFLHFLSHVAARNATGEIDIRVVFRTFGDDIPEVAKELELLVEGTHPFPLPTPLPASFKLLTKGDQVGTFYRDGFGSDGTALAIGSLTKVAFTKDGPAQLETFYNDQEDAGMVEIVRGFEAIDARVKAMTTRHATLALRDYWEWWSAHAEAGEYGKLLLVDAAANCDMAVFLDDHIEAHHAHIVDVRDVATGQPVAFAESTRRRFLQRVEPFAAITDDQYFIKLLEPLFH